MRTFARFGWIFAMVFIMSFQVSAEEKAQAPVATVNVDALSAYIWRAITINDGVVVQPSLDVAHPSGWGLNVWGNMDMDTYDGRYEEREFSEVDLTVSYALPLDGPVGFTLGYSEYLYPKEGNYSPEVPEGHPEVKGVDDSDTREVWGKLSFSPTDTLSFDIGVYRDVDQSQGWYGDLTVTYSYSLSDALASEVSAHLGLADKRFAEASADGNDGGFFDWGASLRLNYVVTDNFSVGANIAFVDNIDDDTLPDSAVEVNWYGGVNAALSF